MSYRAMTCTTGEELWARVDRALERFVDLAASAPPDRRLDGSPWTVRDLVGHTLTVARRYTERDVTSTDGLGETPREVDVLNERELAALGTATREDLFEQLRDQVEQVRSAFPVGTDLNARYPFHGGAWMDGAGLLSNLIGEFMLHGRDLARTLDRDWPIEPRDAELVLNGVVQILPAYVNRTRSEALHLSLRVPGCTPWSLVISGGTMTSRATSSGDRPDAIVRAPAVPLMLALYSRLNPWQTLTSGMVLVGGRRPWRFARLGSLIEKP